MKIAIVSLAGHLECLGFLFEMLREYADITVFLDIRTDKYNWIDYYKTLYSFVVIYGRGAIDRQTYDHIIKLTSNDPCFEYDPSVISLLHAKEVQNQNNSSRKCISLTPYIHGEYINYIFPAFSPQTTYSPNARVITLIGYSESAHFDDDTLFFIQMNPEYTFVFVVWGDNNYESVLAKATPNIRILHSVNTLELSQLIQQSKYILSKKYIGYDRFSGQLSLAISFEKPLIIDKKTAEAYRLPGIVFEKDYSEFGRIDQYVSMQKYADVVENTRFFKERAISIGTETLVCRLLTKNTVLLVEPRILPKIPSLLERYRMVLPNWHFVFYCGKGDQEYWEERLPDEWDIEIRELDVNNYDTEPKYSAFMKRRELWDSLYGEYVLSIQTDSFVVSIEPYNIDFFLRLNKSYIGGNMVTRWNELVRENINPPYINFNGGLSLRKRKDMIRVIEAFPPLLPTGISTCMETDPEDVYFTVGCIRLGLPIGDDEASSHFAIHKIPKDAFFGIHHPAFDLILNTANNSSRICIKENSCDVQELPQP